VLTVVFVVIMIALVAAFSVQNAMPISVTLLSWHFEASLAVVILLSVLAGMVIGIIVVSSIWLQRAAIKKREAGAKQDGGPQ
jgi:putative membrane protein